MHSHSLFLAYFILFIFGLGILGLRAENSDKMMENQDQPVTLVELYSSEGCSSCPPAEAWISRLKSDPRLWKQIVPVVFHVDYWDGLGWPDRFARKAFTERQSQYQASWGSGTVYTPEFIVSGREWHAWFDGDALPLEKTAPAGKLRLLIHSNGAGMQATYSPATKQSLSGLELHVAWLGMNITSDVQRGENSGHQLLHDFVVLDFQTKTLNSANDGVFTTEISAPSFKGDHPAALAAWVTSQDGIPLQTVGGWLAQD
jgi:hypothetical protein